MKRGGTPSEDRGAVAIIVAVFAIVAMILLAFVVDRGRIYTTRASLQNAVDAAALAAAQAFCGGTGDPVAIAQQYGTLNGETVEAPRVAISPGSTSYVNVQASRTVDLVFGAFTGAEAAGVAAQATALKACNAGYAIFAGTAGFADSGGMNISGSIYSQGDAQITSATNSVVDGSIDYSSTCSGCTKAKLPDGSQTELNGGAPSKSTRCFAYEIALDRPVPNTTGCSGKTANLGAIQSLTYGPATCPATITAAWMAANPTVTALNCPGDVTISSWDSSAALIAVSAAGQIVIDGSMTIGNSGKAVILYSESSGRGVEIKGNSELTLYGYLYVPQGEVYVGGSSNLSWTGSVIADEVDINGTGSGGGTVGFLALDPVVRLYQ